MNTMNTGAASLSECDFVAVPRAAVEWLKEHYPALTEKAGMCERIGKRLYTKTTLANSTPQAGAAIAAGGAQEPDVFEWLETELSAISCRYHGDPSYDHDAYWMKDRVMKLIADARKAFPLPHVAATVALTDEQRHSVEFAATLLESRGYTGRATDLRALLAASNGEKKNG